MVILKKTSFLFLFFTLFIGSYWILSQNEQRRALKIYTYSSFMSSWGPGPLLKKEFEKTCRCLVQFVNAGDSGLILQRLKLEGSDTDADMVLGLDQLHLREANKLSWRKIDLSSFNFDPRLPQNTLDQPLIPFDWSPLTFVVRSEAPITFQSIDALLESRWSKQISIQDPRTSTPGLQLLFWILTLKGESDGFVFVENLLKQVHSVSSSWSTSYGLFQKKQVKMTFSYMTSPLYHLIEEKTSEYKAISFAQGHPIQTEFMGILRGCRQCNLAKKFTRFLLSPEGQKIIMLKNYMLPVIQGVTEGTPFASLPEFQVVDQSVVSDFIEQKDALLKKWVALKRRL